MKRTEKERARKLRTEKGLSLKERLNNIEAIINAYCKDHADANVNLNLVCKITGLRKEQASLYLTVMRAPKGLKKHLINENIGSIKKAAFIARIKDEDVRNKVLTACLAGHGLKSLQQLLDVEKKATKSRIDLFNRKPETRGKKATRVNLGFTQDPKVIMRLVNIVTEHPDYKKYVDEFSAINWEEFSEASKGFKKLLSILINNDELTT